MFDVISRGNRDGQESMLSTAMSGQASNSGEYTYFEIVYWFVW